MSTTDEAAIRQIAKEVNDALNRGDAKAYAAFYTQDADYVDSFGRASKGRANIEASFQALLTGPYKGAKFTTQIESIRFLTPSIALTDFTTDATIPQGPPRKLHAVSISIKQGDRWVSTAGRSWVLTAVPT
jgi:uncharacterized protein (TIGR02246 family)